MSFLEGQENVVSLFQGQTKLWQQEATELANALRLDSAYARDIEPAAKAEAIVMESSRRQE